LVRKPLRSGALVNMPVAVSTCESEIYAVWPQTLHLLPKLRRVIDVLAMKGREGLLS
jgi:DNA-binding transcriptional LysR family regulator